jgi:restriction endonuclease
MRNSIKLKDIHYYPQYRITPAITKIAIPLLVGRTEEIGIVEQPSQQKTKKPKQRSIKVEKYEVSQYILKLLIEKGFFKKRWVAIKEIPINEITLIKNLGNELSITWNGINYSFVIKSKQLSFSGLPDQIQHLLKEQQKNLENITKANQKTRRLAELIDT